MFPSNLLRIVCLAALAATSVWAECPLPTTETLQELVTLAREDRFVNSPNQRVRSRGKIVEVIASSLLKKSESYGLTSFNPVDETDIKWMCGAIREPVVNADRLTANPNQGFDPSLPFKIVDGHFKQSGKTINFFGAFKFTVFPSDSSIESWQDQLGMNLFGGTSGPKWTLPKQHVVVTEYPNLLSQPYGANELLYSAHKLADWMRHAFPDLKREGFGFLHYNIESQHSKDIHAKTIETVMRDLRERHSLPTLLISVANEPAYAGSTGNESDDGAPGATELAWRKWLESDAKTIDEINHRWRPRKPFKHFKQIHVPSYVRAGDASDGETVEIPHAVEKLPEFYDWSRFNNDRLADFLLDLHRQMKTQYPNALYHTKWLSSYPVNSASVAVGLNPVKVMKSMDIVDCDSWILYGGTNVDFAVRWQSALLCQTMMRSLHPKKPLMNSENHFQSNPAKFTDSSSPNATQPGAYFRSTFWLEAIFGLQASFQWTFDFKPFLAENPNSLLNGSAEFDRAEILDAVHQTRMEFAQFRNEINSFQDQTANVAVVLSHASLTREAGLVAKHYGNGNSANRGQVDDNGYFGLSNVADPTTPNCSRVEGHPTHLSAFCDTMFALMQMGKPVDVLMEGTDQDFSAYRAVILPHARYLEGGLVLKLRRAEASGTRIFVMGEAPQFDPYGRLSKATFTKVHQLTLSAGERGAHDHLSKWLKQEKLLPGLVVTDEAGAIPYGIVWRVVERDDQKLVYVMNLTKKSQTVRLSVGGAGLDVIAGTRMKDRFDLRPLEMRLLSVVAQ